MTTGTSGSATPTAVGIPKPVEQASSPHWAALPIILIGVFLSGLDFFIVAVAIPSLHKGRS